MRGIIISNGDMKNFEYIRSLLEKDDTFFVADGAIRYIEPLKISPNYILGDFDSGKFEDAKKYNQAEIVKFLPEKDMTDSELAINYALKLGFDEIIIIGALGGRFDHMMGNVFLLKTILDKGAVGRIIDEQNIIELHTEKSGIIKIEAKTKEYVSIIPLSEVVEGVTLNGFKYPLNSARLVFGDTLTISNEIGRKEAWGTVEFKKGSVLIVISKDKL